MLNKKDRARLDEIENQVLNALNLIKTQKIRNDALILRNAELEDQISELRSRLRAQDADV
jgi:hypothetical protein